MVAPERYVARARQARAERLPLARPRRRSARRSPRSSRRRSRSSTRGATSSARGATTSCRRCASSASTFRRCRRARSTSTPDCSRLTGDSFRFALDLLERAGVAITPGIDFGSHRAARARALRVHELDRAAAGRRRAHRALPRAVKRLWKIPTGRRSRSSPTRRKRLERPGRRESRGRSSRSGSPGSWSWCRFCPACGRHLERSRSAARDQHHPRRRPRHFSGMADRSMMSRGRNWARWTAGDLHRR